MRFRFAADLAEPHEGMHLVLVAAHGAGHGGDQQDIRIGGSRKQVVIAAQSPQQTIEDSEAFGVAVQDGGLRQLDEFGRHTERAFRNIRQR